MQSSGFAAEEHPQLDIIGRTRKDKGFGIDGHGPRKSQALEEQHA